MTQTDFLTPLQTSAIVNIVHRTTFEICFGVCEDWYEASDWLVNPDLTILDTVEPKHVKVVGEEVVEKTTQEKEDADEAELEDYKFRKCVLIDRKTGALIANGFAHDGETFSLSLCSQAKFTGANMVRDEPGFSYPVKWNTKNDRGAYEVNDSAGMKNLYVSGIGTIRNRLDSGTSLKDQVRAAANKSAVDAVEDDR